MTTKLYSYVVDHDHGISPNPFQGICTLVHCKFSRSKVRRNIVELANVGDWILGTGGKNPESAGNGHIIYIMRVDEKLPFSVFLNDPRFANRADQCDLQQGNKFALISTNFYYFGRNAIAISKLPDKLRTLPLEKRGPSYRADLLPDSICLLISWLEENFNYGMHGEPCAPLPVNSQAGLVSDAHCLSSGCSSSCRKETQPAVKRDCANNALHST